MVKDIGSRPRDKQRTMAPPPSIGRPRASHRPRKGAVKPGPKG